MQCPCQPSKQSHILRSISDLHFTDKSQPRVSKLACGIAPSQVRDASARTYPRFISGPAAAGPPHSKSSRKAQQCCCAVAVLSVHKDQRSAVGFGNLTTQWQTDPRTLGLCGEKRHEKICRVHNALSLILDKDFNATFFIAPPDRDVSLSFKCRIYRVVHQIN